MSQMPAAATIGIRDLQFRASGQLVLDGLHLSLGSGEILGLMGPSGCGKTSLLRILAGLVPRDDPTDDRPSWSGFVTWEGGQRPWRTGVVFQEDRLLPSRTIGHNLRLACAGLPENARKPALAEMTSILLVLGLAGDAVPDIQNQLPSALSGGMRHRVAIARALLFGRELQLWDEPFQGLDPSLRLKIAAMARERFNQLNSAAIVAGHDVSDMLVLCDRILIMDRQATSVGQTVRTLIEFQPRLPAGPRNFDTDEFRAERQRLETLLHARGILQAHADQESRLIT